MVSRKSRTPRSGAPKPGAAKPRAAALRAATVKPRTAAIRKDAAAGPKPDKILPDPVAADLVVAGIGGAAADEEASSTEVATGGNEGTQDTQFKKKHLFERVVALSGVKKRVAKDVVEATLSALGDALGEGRTVNLPPLGKLTVNRQKDIASGEVLIVKLRRTGAAGKPVADPLADTGEDG